MLGKVGNYRGMIQQHKKDYLPIESIFLQSFVSEGKTVLMTSHYMSELEVTVDQLVGISNGKIVIDAPTKDILKQFGSFEEAYFKSLEGKEGE